MARKTLLVKNFGPIRHVEVPLSDITVLVGPQATGKSLVLQWLKLAIDKNRVLGTLKAHGYDWSGGGNLLGHYFGEGYEKSYSRTKTEIVFGSNRITPSELAKGRVSNTEHRVLYIPAHRAIIMGTGWPRLFREYSGDTPFVVREFGARVLDVLSSRELETVFPSPRRLREELRGTLDRALFHGGRVVVEKSGVGRKELKLVHGSKTRLSQWNGRPVSAKYFRSLSVSTRPCLVER